MDGLKNKQRAIEESFEFLTGELLPSQNPNKEARAAAKHLITLLAGFNVSIENMGRLIIPVPESFSNNIMVLSDELIDLISEYKTHYGRG